MCIRDSAYLQQLIERKDNGMIKVITGIRRCGKSFLLFTIFKRYLLENGVDVDHIIEIALDGIENEELRDPKVCFKYIKDAMKDDGKYYLLLDEVQFMPRFEEVLNSLLRMSNIDVYVTGSNSKFLSSDIVTESVSYTHLDVYKRQSYDTSGSMYWKTRNCGSWICSDKGCTGLCSSSWKSGKSNKNA